MGSPDSAKRRRADHAQYQRDYVARLHEQGETAEDRLSEAALAHKRGLTGSQRASVDGSAVWVQLKHPKTPPKKKKKKKGPNPKIAPPGSQGSALPYN
jgi:hypothetical protein